MWCEVTGFYLKILFRSDTEAHKSALFPLVWADFTSVRQRRLKKGERKELKEMRWKKLNEESSMLKVMENRKENVIFASCAAEKFPQAEQQVIWRPSNITLHLIQFIGCFDLSSVIVFSSTSTMTTSMGRRRSLCVGGRNALESRSPSRHSTCWWSTCAGILGKNLTSAR